MKSKNLPITIVLLIGLSAIACLSMQACQLFQSAPTSQPSIALTPLQQAQHGLNIAKELDAFASDALVLANNNHWIKPADAVKASADLTTAETYLTDAQTALTALEAVAATQSNPDLSTVDRLMADAQTLLVGVEAATAKPTTLPAN